MHKPCGMKYLRNKLRKNPSQCCADSIFLSSLSYCQRKQDGLFCLALFTAACLFRNVMYDGNARYSLVKMMIIYLNKLRGI